MGGLWKKCVGGSPKKIKICGDWEIVPFRNPQDHRWNSSHPSSLYLSSVYRILSHPVLTYVQKLFWGYIPLSMIAIVIVMIVILTWYFWPHPCLIYNTGLLLYLQKDIWARNEHISHWIPISSIYEIWRSVLSQVHVLQNTSNRQVVREQHLTVGYREWCCLVWWPSQGADFSITVWHGYNKRRFQTWLSCTWIFTASYYT